MGSGGGLGRERPQLEAAFPGVRGSDGHGGIEVLRHARWGGNTRVASGAAPGSPADEATQLSVRVRSSPRRMVMRPGFAYLVE